MALALALALTLTFVLQNEPPTPPPLNVVGLPCEALCLLWGWLHPRTAKRERYEVKATVTAPRPQAAADSEGAQVTEVMYDEDTKQGDADSFKKERSSALEALAAASTQADASASDAETAAAAELRAEVASAAAEKVRLSTSALTLVKPQPYP